MKTSHTPGPWRATYNTDHYEASVRESTGLILDEDGCQVADTGIAYWHNLRAAAARSLTGGEFDDVIQAKEADARLIAAAPELLAALENAERMLIQIRGQADNVEIYCKSEKGCLVVASTIRDLTRDALAPIRAAIAKAEGKS